MPTPTQLEEQLNTITHAIGVALGVAALVLLIMYAETSKPWHLFSVVVYGVSIIILFLASTSYHAISNKKRKHYFRIADHISIYLLIAGTYTPVLLIALNHSLGWTLFWVVWSIALFGVVLKLFFTGKFEAFSTLLYLIMGWLIVFDYKTLTQVMPQQGINLLIAGGLCYTIGIIFYAIEKIPYNHVIWHLFVLAGAICHFFMIFCYVI